MSLRPECEKNWMTELLISFVYGMAIVCWDETRAKQLDNFNAINLPNVHSTTNPFNSIYTSHPFIHSFISCAMRQNFFFQSHTQYFYCNALPHIEEIKSGFSERCMQTRSSEIIACNTSHLHSTLKSHCKILLSKYKERNITKENATIIHSQFGNWHI